MTLIEMWTEKSLPVLMAAVGLMISQVMGIAYFVSNPVGSTLIGTAKHRFEETNPFSNRSLALFHI